MKRNCDEFDIRSWQNKALNSDIKTMAYKSQPTNISQIVNPKNSYSSFTSNLGLVSNSFFLDTFTNLSNSSLTAGRLIFDIKALNQSTPIQNVFRVKINPFYFPNITNTASGVDYYYHRELFIDVEEFSSLTGYVNGSGSFYWKCNISNSSGAAVLVTPEESYYTFTRPINTIETLSLRFSKVFSYINLPPSVISVRTTIAGAGFNPARFTILGGYDTTLFGPVGVLALADQVAVIFQLHTNNSSVDSATNGTNGWLITNIIDANTFEVSGLDHSSLTVPSDGTMYILKNRVAFTITFLSTQDNATNYVAPVI